MSAEGRAFLALPDLTSAEGRSVAQDMLMDRGFRRCEVRLEPLWQACPNSLLEELNFSYAEATFPLWEKEFPGDLRLQELIEAKRAWFRGEADLGVLVAARTRATSRSRPKSDGAREALGRALWASRITPAEERVAPIEFIHRSAQLRLTVAIMLDLGP